MFCMLHENVLIQGADDRASEGPDAFVSLIVEGPLIPLDRFSREPSGTHAMTCLSTLACARRTAVPVRRKKCEQV